MKIVNIVLCILMLVFITVQYNDPDGPMWMAIYLIPTVWAGLAAFAPRILSHVAANGLLLLCILASILATLYYWPKTPGWWKSEVWWEVETAREGMGMMIVTFVLLVAWWSGRRDLRRNSTKVGSTSLNELK